MEGREAHRPLYPNDKTIPFPLGSALSLGGGVFVFWLGLVMAYWGRSEGDRQCVWGERCEYSCTFIH